MSEAKSPPTFRAKLTSVCVFLSVLSAVVLLIVWALADTIAARNISIALGLLASTGWVLLACPKINRSDFIVPALLMGVPIWLWVIYFFFPIDPVAQYKEMTGTWLRIMLLIIFGFNLGLMISRDNKLAIWIWLALASLPVAAILMYLRDVYIGGVWDIPNYTAFFKTKIAGAYFLILPSLVSFAALHKVSVNFSPKSSILRALIRCLFPLILLGTSFMMFSIIQSLIGVLISAMALMAFVLIFLGHIFNSSLIVKYKLILFFFILIPISLSAIYFWKYDATHNQNIKHLAHDILVSKNISASTFWIDDPYCGCATMPKLDGARKLNLSTYERISWFMKGFELLLQNPLGSGDSYFSFGRYMRMQYPGSRTSKTHSGWLDLALGIGFPGLCLIWVATYYALRAGLRMHRSDSTNFLPIAALWLLGSLWVLWWPGELSYREFIEHYFFIFVFLASSLTVQSGSLTTK
jgi:hypothetical protein